MTLLLAWIVGFFIPPLAILLLPNECEKNKVVDFVIALILTIFYLIPGWLYVFPKISACETILQAQQTTHFSPSQPVPVTQATPQVVGAAAKGSGKVIVVNVNG